jgi:hypothetical protein
MKNDKQIAVFVAGIDRAGEVGKLLLPILEKQDPIQKRNILVLLFVRKTLRLLDAMKCLLMYQFDEEAQILIRALFETRITFDYFLILAQNDYTETLGRYVDCVMLDKMRQIEALDFSILPAESDKNHWIKLRNEISARYTPEVLAKMKKFGFTCLSLEARAIKTGNKKLYDMVYRMYSQNVHSTDVTDQLTQYSLPDKHNEDFHDTRIGMILNVAFLCGIAVIKAANEWLGNPVDLSKYDLSKPPTSTMDEKAGT